MRISFLAGLATVFGSAAAPAADVKVGLEDLSPAKQAELKRAGLSKLSLSMTVEVPPLAAGAAPWGKPVGAVRWTHPADVRRHLIEEHKFDPGMLAGMTDRQMEAIHDALHDAEVAKAAAVPKAVVAAPQYQVQPQPQYQVQPVVQQRPVAPYAMGWPTAGACPGGVCPTGGGMAGSYQIPSFSGYGQPMMYGLPAGGGGCPGGVCPTGGVQYGGFRR